MKGGGRASSSPIGCMTRCSRALPPSATCEPIARACPGRGGNCTERAASADALLAFMTDRCGRRLSQRVARASGDRTARSRASTISMSRLARRPACGSRSFLTFSPIQRPSLPSALALGLGRNLREADALVRTGTFEGWRPILYGTGLDQSVVGIVGLGAVGRAIATRLSGFGCRLLGVDPGRELPAGIVPCDLLSALADSDYIVLAVPLAPGTFI